MSKNNLLIFWIILNVSSNTKQNKELQRKLKHIAVTNEVYEQLSNQGKAGDSFNDVVERLLGRNATPNEILKNIGENQ